MVVRVNDGCRSVGRLRACHRLDLDDLERFRYYLAADADRRGLVYRHVLLDVCALMILLHGRDSLPLTAGSLNH
jgi:hypothetical protein